MKIRFFTDPHIGLNRTSHTTPASRVRLKSVLVKQVDKALAYGEERNVCLGDLFDTYATDNNSLLEGLRAFNKCDLVLFGNHDLSNRTDQLSSIELASILERQEDGVRFDVGTPRASSYRLGASFWWVDHKLNQEIFEGALQDAYDQAVEGSILLLHCNYDSPFATQESTLNLTRENAEILLSKFAYILIGHEHMPRQDFDGRVMLLGNTHPTGFSDISDKFAWDFEIENGKVVKTDSVKIWSEDEGYLSLDWTKMSDLLAIGDKVQFVEVTGVADQQHMPLISSQVANLWHFSDNLLMVRNNVISSQSISTQDIAVTRCQSIPERISAELAGTKLEPLWNSYLEAV